MKTNRATLLDTIARIGITTLDDMQTATDWPRRKCQDTANDLINCKLVKRIKDDTGVPAYQLTPEGKAAIKNSCETPKPGEGENIPGTAAPVTFSGNTLSAGGSSDNPTTGGEQNTPSPVAVEIDMPTDKACCNAAKVVATTAGAEVAALNARISQLEVEASDARIIFCNLRKTLALKEGDSLKLAIEALQDDIRRQVQRADAAERNRDDIKTALEQVITVNDGWLALAAEFECKSIPELRVFINAAVDRCNTLKSENLALQILETGMPGFGKTFAGLTQADLPAGVNFAHGGMLRSELKPATRGVVIKPCPFCDHDAVQIESLGYEEFSVTCPSCSTNGPMGSDVMDCISLWNERVPEAA